MKIRNGFVPNSSSSSFAILNLTNVKLTLADFVEEVGGDILIKFNHEYGHSESYDEMLASTCHYESDINPGVVNEFSFGDEDRNALGQVFDYGLRHGGMSKRFAWCMTSCRGSEEDGAVEELKEQVKKIRKADPLTNFLVREATGKSLKPIKKETVINFQTVRVRDFWRLYDGDGSIS